MDDKPMSDSTEKPFWSDDFDMDLPRVLAVAREHLAWLVRQAYEAGMRAGWESVRRGVMVEALRVGR